jgi:DNA helicase-2/ATP-dependent DNA helicase PcrA
VASGDGVLDHKAVRAVLARLAKRSTGPFAMVAADLEALATAESEEAGPVSGRSVSGADPGADERRAALVGLAGLARTYERADQQPTTEGFLEWLRAGSGESSGNPRGTAGAVTLSSFHRAKGLEWLAVWVTGLERGLVPNGHAVTPAAQAEERRLLYVGLTRAERELHCSWSEHREFGGRMVPREPSPWLDLIAQAGISATGDPGSEATELSRQRLRVERERLERSRPRRGVRCPDADPAIVEALQAWRSRAARAAAVPPYVLLHDVTLAALAAARPSTIEELIAVPGMGQVKATRYGSTLLAVMADQRASA